MDRCGLARYLPRNIDQLLIPCAKAVLTTSTAANPTASISQDDLHKLATPCDPDNAAAFALGLSLLLDTNSGSNIPRASLTNSSPKATESLELDRPGSPPIFKTFMWAKMNNWRTVAEAINSCPDKTLSMLWYLTLTVIEQVAQRQSPSPDVVQAKNALRSPLQDLRARLVQQYGNEFPRIREDLSIKVNQLLCSIGHEAHSPVATRAFNIVAGLNPNARYRS